MAAPTRSLWSRLRGSRFLLSSILVHVLFAIGAAIYVVQVLFVKGPAVSATVGNYYDMEILIGEQPGGEFFADLLIEKDGTKYEKESHGSPVLPIFRVPDGKMPALKSGEKMPPCLPNGPVSRAEVVSKTEKK